MTWSTLRPVDAHTHLHPPRLFAAIRRWFDENTHWKLREPTEPEAVAAFLEAQGIERFVFFSYAPHRNDFVGIGRFEKVMERVPDLPAQVTNDQLIRWQDRVIYGSDHPNLPYTYEEERRDLLERGLPDGVLRKLFRENAVPLYRLT